MANLKNKKYLFLILITIALIASGTTVFFILSNNSNQASNNNLVNVDYSKNDNKNNNTGVEFKYKDGEYMVSNSYRVPRNLTESITVTVKIQDDTIVDVNFKGESNNNDSRRYMNLFADNYKKYVLGKKLDGLSVGTIAGASLTSQAFNESLSKIREQAKK